MFNQENLCFCNTLTTPSRISQHEETQRRMKYFYTINTRPFPLMADWSGWIEIGKQSEGMSYRSFPSNLPPTPGQLLSGLSEIRGELRQCCLQRHPGEQCPELSFLCSNPCITDTRNFLQVVIKTEKMPTSIISRLCSSAAAVRGSPGSYRP